jgi:hypothetical protein
VKERESERETVSSLPGINNTKNQLDEKREREKEREAERD